MESTENCTVFSNSQYKILSVARGSSAAVVFVLTLLLFIASMRVKVRRMFLEKLLIYITMVTLVRTALFILQMIEEIAGDPRKFCEAMAFFIEWASWVQVSTAFLLSLYQIYLLLKVVMNPEELPMPHNPSKWQYTILILGWTPIPLLLVWIPFSVEEVGPPVPWCWLASISEDCVGSMRSFIEEIIIWYTPLFIVTGYAIHLALYLTLVYCCMSIRYKQLRQQGPQHWRLIVTYTLYCLLSVVELVARMHTKLDDRHSFELWLSYAIATSLRDLVLVGGYSFYLYNLCSCMETENVTDDEDCTESSLEASAFVNVETVRRPVTKQLQVQYNRNRSKTT